MKILVSVKPKSGREEVIKKEKDCFIVRVKETPEKGKAMKAAAKAIADYFNVAQSKVKLISGEKSRLKKFDIS